VSPALCLRLSRLAPRGTAITLSQVATSSPTPATEQGKATFRFDRTATVRNAADMPAAVQFAAHVTSYLKL